MKYVEKRIKEKKERCNIAIKLRTSLEKLVYGGIHGISAIHILLKVRQTNLLFKCELFIVQLKDVWRRNRMFNF